MDNKDFLIKEDTLTNIADNIRNVDSTLDKMTPTQMADEIKRLTAVIDQRYNASSTNPQAGIAVAEGIQQERERAQLAEEQNEQNIINETTERKQADSGLQSQIDNIEATFQTELDKKLDKQTSDVFKVYGTRDNQQIMTEVSDSSESKINTIAMRDDQGHLSTKTPTLDGHATNKKYVDTLTAENENHITQEIADRKEADNALAQQIANITAVQIRNKSEIINSTEAEVQTTATQYIVDNYQRQPQNFDGLIVTVTDKNNDKILYIYSEVSNLWINSGINNVDLSNYYTKNEVDTKIDALNKQIVSFDIYSSKTEFTTVDVLIPSK